MITPHLVCEAWIVRLTCDQQSLKIWNEKHHSIQLKNEGPLHPRGKEPGKWRVDCEIFSGKQGREKERD